MQSIVPERKAMNAQPSLSPREIEVLRAWVVSGSKDAVARRLYITSSTVNTHICRIREKYNDAGRSANTKAKLLARALQDGHVLLEEL
ncbi:LuxR C-terminal-related transcriptional regulator [Rhodococcus sp. Q]|uniref:LuxR C-terminal-related transcriptional regulator n=1 Tax=Rhodococcus sp. Q TaxID=2502252 RepID=UPI0010F5A354|nr:LuxR C-terminal-related transcriptional regulator [Rhodococcus sp. Q]